MCDSLRPPDVPEAADLICRVFLDHEPTSRALGLSREVFLPFARAYCRRSAEDGTGAVVREGDRLLGAVTCLDLLEDLRERFPELQGPRFAAKLPDLAFVARLEEPYVQEHGLRPGECAHIAQIAVADEGRGRGLAVALLETACEAARQRGYGRVVSLCTGPASRRAHEKAGFQVEKTMRYATYEYEGSRPFAEVPGDCALLVRRL